MTVAPTRTSGVLVTNHSERRVSSPVAAVAPEVIAGLALGKRQAVTGGERAFGVRPAESSEDQYLAQVDE